MGPCLVFKLGPPLDEFFGLRCMPSAVRARACRTHGAGKANNSQKGCSGPWTSEMVIAPSRPRAVQSQVRARPVQVAWPGQASHSAAVTPGACWWQVMLALLGSKNMRACGSLDEPLRRFRHDQLKVLSRAWHCAVPVLLGSQRWGSRQAPCFQFTVCKSVPQASQS